MGEGSPYKITATARLYPYAHHILPRQCIETTQVTKSGIVLVKYHSFVQRTVHVHHSFQIRIYINESNINITGQFALSRFAAIPASNR